MGKEKKETYMERLYKKNQQKEKKIIEQGYEAKYAYYKRIYMRDIIGSIIVLISIIALIVLASIFYPIALIPILLISPFIMFIIYLMIKDSIKNKNKLKDIEKEKCQDEVDNN